MIEVRYKARLGNNLFQYALGRILAEELGFALRADMIAGFPNTGQEVLGAAHDSPTQVLSGNRVDLAALLSDRSARRIVLDGWFQRIEYFRPWRERIRRWLEIAPRVVVPEERPELVVHVRRTDYVANGWALPFAYFEEALKRCQPVGGGIWIATDDPKDPFLRRFGRWKPKILTSPALDQFAVMMQAKKLILSQSTFCWWPAFLGNAGVIIAPRPSHGVWSGGDEMDGADLIEEGRFSCLVCGKQDPPTRRERRYQASRKLKRTWILRLNRRLGLSLRVPPP